MNMKWNPIENGDLSGIPSDERLLFTGIDHGELYVDFGYIESRLEKLGIVSIGDLEIQVEAKELIAWMEIPEPYQPGRCYICNYYHVWIDCFGDHWSGCKLGDDVFSKSCCPLEK